MDPEHFGKPRSAPRASGHQRVTEVDLMALARTGLAVLVLALVAAFWLGVAAGLVVIGFRWVTGG